jgi:hypothetical protein
LRYKLVIEPDVLAQMFSVSLFYDSQKLGLGEEFEAEIRQILNTICENPLLYPINYRDVHRALAERFHHHIYYIIESKAVVVVEFRDARREPPKYQR